MIKSETGTVSMRGTTPVLVSELAFMVKGMRESFAKEYGESAAEELISRAMEASKAEYEKPFAYEEELKSKIARQYELDAQLDLENGKVEDVDLAASEDKDIARNVAEEKGPYRTGGNGYTR